MGTPRQQVGGSRFQGVAGTLWLVSPQRSAFIEASTNLESCDSFSNILCIYLFIYLFYLNNLFQVSCHTFVTSHSFYATSKEKCLGLQHLQERHDFPPFSITQQVGSFDRDLLIVAS